MKLLLHLSLLLAALPATAQTVDATFASPTSLYEPASLYDLGPAQADGKRLLLGSFTRVSNTPTGGVVRLDASGALDQPFAQNAGLDSRALSVRPGLNGQYLLGGDYDGIVVAGGLSRNSVLRLNADGTGDATFDAGSGPAATPGNNNLPYTEDFAVQPDGKVLVGGAFDRYSGAVAGGLVRLTSSGSVDASFATGTGAIRDGRPGEVRTLLVLPNGQVLAGGGFSTFNGQAVSGLVRLNANGSVDTTLPTVFDPSSFIGSLLLQPDGKILVRGYLVNIGSNVYHGLLRLLPSGALDTSFTPDASVDNLAIAFDRRQLALQADGKILLAGALNAGGNGLTRLTTTGSLDASLAVAGAPLAAPFAVGVQPSGKILVGAAATNIFNGTLESSLGQYTSTGSFDATYLPKLQAASSVLAIARQQDGSLLAGGFFTEWNGQPVHRVVHLSATGTLDMSFTAQAGVLPGGVRSLVVQPDGRLVVGTGTGVRRFAASGAPDASFTSPPDIIYINKLLLQPDGKLLVGGDFNRRLPDGSYASSVVRLSSTGALDPSFVMGNTSVGTLGSVSSLVLQPDGRVVAAGFFYSQGGSTPFGYYVVRVESTGAQDASFAPQATAGGANSLSPLNALALQPDGKLLVGGDFAQLGSANRPGLARLNANGTPDAGFVPGSQFLGTVYSLAVQPNGRVLVGGRLVPAGSSAGANLARVLTTGQPDPSFATTATPSNAVYDLLIQPDGAIVLAGTFTLVDNQPRLALARITAPNVLAVAAPAATAARTTAWPVPARELLHIAPDPAAQPQLAELLDALGRPVRHQPLTSTAEFTLPTAGLPAGVYLLRLTYATGTVTRQLAVE